MTVQFTDWTSVLEVWGLKLVFGMYPEICILHVITWIQMHSPCNNMDSKEVYQEKN